ncbi:hypothetical protein J3Q64DRAFT_1343698 [Phycomyces blakesleeanus]|uniref:Uncharacterized protein n=2 Tax=Phycomyces blakesleeanus TaxID=4837 RepID=A0A163BES2_PHYB8|nr:hypothetical protein PHYBLDRAFT_138670 [Phycomyces blakesleeanus NRRL 1555(-)]OAD81121.1 hypothetical protein PHYBLDRAFT_138670 [Phycomyces blakesleeanus NRRL 1555(-)]|eukprot:XP_018299161.1 hypothetical protein PHYBLDRAFT_138670 [Phycomyces blakesleeanus NRRL 1555(-)]
MSFIPRVGISIATKACLNPGPLARPLIRRAFLTPVRTMSTPTAASASRDQQNNLRVAASHFKRQRHLPYFLEYLMWVVFGSEALHLIWLKMEYKEYKEKVEHKIQLLQEIVTRIEQGQEFTDSLREEIKMVLLNNKQASATNDVDIDDAYLEKLIASSEKQSVAEDGAEFNGPVEEKRSTRWVESTETIDGKKKPVFL